ncbi:ExeA family protein [Planctomicrobium piriforme]|uniref:General secretion pathway protein A n=1 Tax=Planctomicrobium piriforme TaxID=1576369 RepID=A0A1I3C4W2_9PLAN|nr:AAA family ATPase [Planctomicrobium piriforme]SFH69209.1 general secretion pathway protein A [Planctomicrobium piriforme]
MYRAYWNLSRRPFDDGALPEFYFPSAAHQAALLKLRYLVEQQKGLGVIAGEHGLGKTYLTHVLESELAPAGNFPFLRLVFPQLSPAGTLAYLARRLGAAVASDASDAIVLAALEQRLAELRDAQQHIIFLIDDAHLLELPQLHLLRLMLNFREEGIGAFSLILSGRTEVLSRLQQVAALDQRVAVRTAVEPLSPEEVLPYAIHRLWIAGRKDPIFNEAAAESIWQLSQGIPRRINQLCDLALLVGYVDHQRAISAVDVEAAAEELVSVAA